MQRSEAAKLYAVLQAAFPNARTTPQTREVYEANVIDLDYPAADRACRRLIATSRFLPTIAEIRSATVDAQAGHQRLGGEAWGDVGAAIARFGSYRSPQFDDPLVAECVKQMGWGELCSSSNVTADRARFVQLYDGVATRARADAAAGEALALPAPKRQEPARRLRAVPGFTAIGSGKTA